MGYVKQAAQWLWALLPLAFFVWVIHGSATAPQREAERLHDERTAADTEDHDRVLDPNSGVIEIESRIRTAIAKDKDVLTVHSGFYGTLVMPASEPWRIACDSAGLRLSWGEDEDAVVLSTGTFSDEECAILAPQSAHILSAL